MVYGHTTTAEASADADEQFEDCLSFFDVRGMVPGTGFP
jgi:hypothetical protein